MVIAPPVDHPSIREIRLCFDAEATCRSTLLGVCIFLLHFSLYWSSFIGISLASWWSIKLSLAIFNGLFIGSLFVVGHDACHGNLTLYRFLNRMLGRLAILPSWIPYTSWVYGHNYLHHGFTNLKGKDYVWTPKSIEEYKRLSPSQRFLERVYKSLPGIALYWIIEMWWNHMLFPKANDRPTEKEGRSFFLDRLIVLAFVILQCLLLISMDYLRSRLSGTSLTPTASLLLLGMILPHLVWSFLVGLLVLVHHIHPSIAWFSIKEEWSFYRAQIQSSTHTELPFRLDELMFGNIMKHTSHHVHPAVPGYRLPDQQKRLENTYQQDILKQVLTPSLLRKILRVCRLYDYDNHRWCDWDGQPTSKRTVERIYVSSAETCQ